MQKQWVASLVFAVCFLETEGQSVKVEESTCDCQSPGFLKLTGPLSVRLIGCLADFAAPRAGDTVMVKPPYPGGGHGGCGQENGFGVMTQMLPGVARVCKWLLCQVPHVHVCMCVVLET